MLYRVDRVEVHLITSVQNYNECIEILRSHAQNRMNRGKNKSIQLRSR